MIRTTKKQLRRLLKNPDPVCGDGDREPDCAASSIPSLLRWYRFEHRSRNCLFCNALQQPPSRTNCSANLIDITHPQPTTLVTAHDGDANVDTTSTNFNGVGDITVVRLIPGATQWSSGLSRMQISFRETTVTLFARHTFGGRKKRLQKHENSKILVSPSVVRLLKILKRRILRGMRVHRRVPKRRRSRASAVHSFGLSNTKSNFAPQEQRKNADTSFTKRSVEETTFRPNGRSADAECFPTIFYPPPRNPPRRLRPRYQHTKRFEMGMKGASERANRRLHSVFGAFI